MQRNIIIETKINVKTELLTFSPAFSLFFDILGTLTLYHS